jgi:HAD superfamily hydrolase (TIGR01490 family)
VTHEVRHRRLTLRDGLWAAFWLARYKWGHANLHDVYQSAAERLTGQREDELGARVESWFGAQVAHRLRAGAQPVLDAHRNAGDTLLLATSSSPYAGWAAARTFGLDDVVSTRFEVSNGVFTGRIEASALGEGKTDQVRDWANANGHDLSRATFYTDSISDASLMEVVGKPVAVHPDRRLRQLATRRKWPIAKWGVANPL